MDRPIEGSSSNQYRRLGESTRPLPASSSAVRATPAGWGGGGSAVRTQQALPKNVKVSTDAEKQGSYGLWQKETSKMPTYLVISGFAMFCFAVALPFCWAVGLLLDRHFKYWFGAWMPIVLVIVSVLFPFFFAGMIAALANKDDAGVKSEQTMVLVGSTFASLFGVILALMSIPLIHSTSGTIAALAVGCDVSNPQAINMIQTSRVLHNIRATPNCTAKATVALCEGYAHTMETDYIREVEGEFHCTGMCKLPTPGNQLMMDPPPAQMLFTGGMTSDICFPEIADRLQVTVASTADLMFWQGVGLIIVGISAGTTKVLDQCFFQKDLDTRAY